MNKLFSFTPFWLCLIIGVVLVFGWLGLSFAADPTGTNTVPLTQAAKLTFAGLPASPSQGMIATITDGAAGNCGDAACTAFGTTVTGGGGALPLLIWYNGTNWTLSGK